MNKLFITLLALVPLAGCGGSGDDCTDGEYSCDGDLLVVCEDGELVEEQDCAADGLICHAEGEHCMEEGMEM